MTRGQRCGFQGTVNAKSIRKSHFSPSSGGLACSDRGAIAPSSPTLVPPLSDVFLIMALLLKLIEWTWKGALSKVDGLVKTYYAG